MYLRTHFFRSRINQTPFSCPQHRGIGGGGEGEKRDYPIFKRRGAPFVCPFALVLTVRFKDYRDGEIPPRDTTPYKMRTYPQELDVKANHTVLIVHRAIMFHSTQGYWLSMSRGFSVPVCV